MGCTGKLAGAKVVNSWSILVADDTHELKTLITGWLQEAGHTTIGASNGRQIIQLVQQQAFDLLVTDILMPDGDGWEAIAEVQRLQPAMRILAISGGARQLPAGAVLRVAQRAGALGYLAKPFSRPEFLDAVATVMSRRRSSASTVTGASRPAWPTRRATAQPQPNHSIRFQEDAEVS
jgi:CheY-like chemotaxis protein